jgi:hypothetical protein
MTNQIFGTEENSIVNLTAGYDDSTSVFPYFDVNSTEAYLNATPYDNDT